MIVGVDTEPLYRNAEKLKALFSVLEDTVYALYMTANRLSESSAVEREAEHLKRLSRASGQELDAMEGLCRVLQSAAETYEEAELRAGDAKEQRAYGPAGTAASAAAPTVLRERTETVEPNELHETYRNVILPLIYTTEGRAEA